MDQTAFPILVLGFLLGMKHALDVDHLAAVTTLIAGQRSRWRSIAVGAWWGVGHSVALLLLGAAIILFGITFPPRVSSALEFCVGGMLIFLGARVLFRIRKGGTVHLHAHEHGGRVHIHPHIHDAPAMDGRPPAPDAARPHHAATPPHHAVASPHHGIAGASPRTPKTSLFVGMIHGAAGSAGLTLLLLPTMPTRMMGIAYLAVFGVGSILGMSLATFVVSLPLGMVGASGWAGRVVSLLAGTLGIAVGILLMVETGGELLRI